MSTPAPLVGEIVSGDRFELMVVNVGVLGRIEAGAPQDRRGP